MQLQMLKLSRPNSKLVLLANRNVPQSEFYNPCIFIGFLQQTRPVTIHLSPAKHGRVPRECQDE